MFKLWKRNKDKGGVKAKKPRKIALFACAAALLASVTGASIMLGLNSHSRNNLGDSFINTGIEGNTASAAADEITANVKTDPVVALSGDTSPDLAKKWKEAMSLSGSVTVILNENWTPGSGSFCPDADKGSTGFSSSGGLVIPANKTVVLNLNGHTINRGISAFTPDRIVITVEAGATLTINGSGTITGGGSGGIVCEGTLNLNGGTITGNFGMNGAGIRMVGSGATLNMYGGTISGHTVNGNSTDGTGRGGGVIVNAATFNMYGGSITGNSARVGGGLEINTNGTFNMYGGSIDNNRSTGIYATANLANPGDEGAGVAIVKGTFNMYGGTISNNKSAIRGAGVAVFGGSTFNMSGGSVSGNEVLSADYGGGGVLVLQSGTMTMSDGTISGNKCEGGAINLFGTMTMSGGNIINNTNCIYGILTANTGATLELNGGLISGNKNGVEADNGNTLKIGGPVKITGNTTGNLQLDTNVKIQITANLNDTDETYVGITSLASVGSTITTDYGTYMPQAVAYRFFYCDNPAYKLAKVGGNGTEIKVVNSGTNTTPVKWSAVVDGQTVNISNAYLGINYGSELSSVTCNVGSDTYTWTSNLGLANTSTSVDSWDASGSGRTQVKDIGKYIFAVRSTKFTDVDTNRMIVVDVKPRPITVTIQNDNSKFGETPKTLIGNITSGSLVGSDTLSDVVSYSSAAQAVGASVGKYPITGKGINANYDVTVVNAVYEITSADVKILINDQSAAYGSKYYSLVKAENKTAVKGTLPLSDDGSKDADGYDVDADGDRVDSNGNKIYNGGWRYADDTASQFVASDLASTTRYPFTISCSPSATIKDITDASNSSYIPVGKYFIDYVASPNYNITFTSNATNGATNSQGVFEITKADVEVLSGSVYAAKKGGTTKAYDSVDYSGSAITVEIPTASFTGTDGKTYTNGAVVLKGDDTITSSNITYRVFGSDKKNVSDTSLTQPEDMPAADDATFWSSNDTSVTDADTYTVYYKIVADPNHNVYVNSFTLSVGAQKTTVKITAKWGNDAIKSTDATVNSDGSKKATYGDSGKALSTEYTFGNTAANGTTMLVYYKNTTPKSDTDTTWKWGAWDKWDDDSQLLEADKNFSKDKKYHKDYGTTNVPTNGGTYTITVVFDPTAKVGFTIDGANTLSGVVINAKEVDIPKGPTTNPVYNGTEQEAFTLTYLTAAVNVKKYADIDDYEDLTLGTSKTVGTNTQQVFKATDAGKYAVVFELKDKDNYKWKVDAGKDASSDQTVELTLDKKAVKVTFNPPKADATSKWNWKPGDYSKLYITYTIDESSLCDDPADNSKKEAVTVNLHMCKKPKDGESAEPITTYVVTDEDTGLEKIDVTKIGTGTYYAYVTLESEDDNPVNKNYTIELDETTDLPKSNTEKVQFKVDDGEVDLSDLNWVYSYTLDGKAVDPAAYKDGELTFKLNKNGSKVTYKLEIDTDEKNGFPAYLDASKITYADNEKTDAGKHTLTVTLHIVSGSDYKFKDEADTGYTYVSDTEATYEYEWNIEKATIKPADVVALGYTVNDQLGFSTVIKDFTEFVKKNDGTDDEPVWVYEADVQGGNYIVPAVQIPENMKTVLTANTPTGDGFFAKKQSKVTESGTLTTTVTFTLNDTANYKLADSPDDKIIIEWRIMVATIDPDKLVFSTPDSNGEYDTELGGTVKDKDGNTITVHYPTPKVESEDVEYVYIYDDGNGEKEYKGLQGLYDLNEIANGLNNGGGGALAGVKVKLVPKDEKSYRMPEGTWETTFDVGDTKTRVEVKPDGALSGTYQDVNVTFTVNRKETDGSSTKLDERLYKFVIYVDGDKTKDPVAFTPEALKALNAGKHLIVVILNNTDDYKLLGGSEEFELEVKKIELALPTLDSNPIFNGGNIEIESK
ncbi:MAG: hypothetical protein K2O41_04820, partial [Clostridia bacterium]|nr:hypothetical protein [Clostridia bacterium]